MILVVIIALILTYAARLNRTPRDPYAASLYRMSEWCSASVERLRCGSPLRLGRREPELGRRQACYALDGLPAQTGVCATAETLHCRFGLRYFPTRARGRRPFAADRRYLQLGCSGWAVNHSARRDGLDTGARRKASFLPESGSQRECPTGRLFSKGRLADADLRHGPAATRGFGSDRQNLAEGPLVTSRATLRKGRRWVAGRTWRRCGPTFERVS